MGAGDAGGPGKIAGLLQFLARHARAVEADFLHHYNGLDLRDLWRPNHGPSRLTFRRVDDLIDRLPVESVTKTETRDQLTPAEFAALAAGQRPGHGQWSHTDYLIAALADRLDRLYHAEYRSQGARTQEFPPLPRPGLDAPAATKAADPAAIAQIERMRAEHRARQEAARQAAQQVVPEPVGGGGDA